MGPKGGPPSKVARKGSNEEEDTETNRESPESISPEERARRVARRLSQPQLSVDSLTGTATETSEDIIVVDDVIQEATSRRPLDGFESATNRVGQVRIEDPSESIVQRVRGRFPSGDDARTVAMGDNSGRSRMGPMRDLTTCPQNVVVTRVQDSSKYKMVDLMANFIRVEPMQERHIYQYRVDFEPNVESRAQRRWFFGEGTKDIFSKRPGFDGMHDIYCSQKLEKKVTIMNVDHPSEPGNQIKLTITCVSDVDWGSFEMMRVYNLHMKKFLHLLGFYQITATGSWVHSDLATPIADGRILSMVRGFKTATHTYDNNKILVQMESVHKLLQRRNVLQVMTDIRNQKPANLREALQSELVGKLVITNYNKRIYRIEDIRYDVRPTGTFEDSRENKQISYVDYYNRRHALKITDMNQPMLQVVPNNKKGKNERGNEGKANEILLVPEFCNITGLTEQQRNDNRLKLDLIRSSQVAPAERVKQLMNFMQLFHDNVSVRDALKEWGYSYEKTPVKIRSHVLPVTKISYGQSFNPVNPTTADFQVNDLAYVPKLDNLVIVTTRVDMGRKQEILANLRNGFEKVKLRPAKVTQIDVNEGDAPANYINCLRRLPNDITAIVVVMHNQNKEKYDSIKKIATVERGIITQCITAKLMLDQKKISGASTKIAIQVAAKIGGEPWWADIPLKKAMICGYDTYRDTAKRGVSYGAFLASLNDHYSRWYSRADSHDQMEQISTQLAESITAAFKKYKEVNSYYPDRIFIYRDGVGEGQLAVVYETELKKILEVIRKIDPNIKLTMIVVNKQVGARFYMRANNTFMNPPPGTAIDHTVTRQGRYDFYLVSQSTRQGTISPTYYNIIHDESSMQVDHHQLMAYKLSLLYYNWSGSVRVPAPCQYAHKLASLCGEHLHSQPNEALSDRLHFL